jgi:hypothetical protein
MRLGRFLFVTILILWACGRPLLERSKPAEEMVAKDIPGQKFQVLATIAGSDARTDLRMSLNVRTMLNQAGVTAVRRTGRWETEDAAAQAICKGAEGKVDGVLFVKYTGLRLVDCETLRNAYQITGNPEAGGPGIRVLTEKLVYYIQGKTKG